MTELQVGYAAQVGMGIVNELTYLAGAGDLFDVGVRVEQQEAE
jgi:hypothetical protein